MASPVVLSWSFSVPVDRASAWQVMSNTDAFNRAAGLGFSFEEEALPDGRVRRFGRVKKFGLTIEWEELPFDFVAPGGFTSRRRFTGGPLRESVASVQLSETPTGTRIDYRVELHPASILTRPIIAADARLTIKPTLQRALDAAMAVLRGEGAGIDPPPPMTQAQEQRLAEALARVQHPRVREALGQRIRFAPLPLVDRLQPLQVAQTTGLSPEAVVHGFLEATRDGLLELRWEMLCPRCRVGKATAATLTPAPQTVHCGSCNIRYDGSFPDNVAVVFRPNPDIRSVAVPVDCLLSPSRTPHVLAQALLPAGDGVQWGVTLQEGGYRLDLAQGNATVEVVEGGPDHDLIVDVESFGVRPHLLRVAPGRRRILVRNRSGKRVAVGLHRQWRPPFTLTAGALLSMPGVQALLPGEALAPGVEPQVRRRVVLAATDPSALPNAPLSPWLQALSAAAERAHEGNQAVIATFATVDEALDWVLGHGVHRHSVGLAVGPVMELVSQEGTLLGGATVEAAVDAMRDVGPGQVAVHGTSKGDDALRTGLAARPGIVQREPGTFCHLYLTVPERRREELEVLHAEMDAREIPSLVHDWVIGQPVAEGGQGRLFEARDPNERRGVLKLLRPELATDAEACQRLRLEAELASAIEHDAVVAVWDHGQLPDGRLYLILEQLHGEDLRQRLDRGALSLSEVVALGERLCDGVGAVHDAGVLHRDLKPANVFLVDGEVARAKVLDFGIAQRLGDAPIEDEHDVLLGTVEYMSPEQLQLDPFDHRSDLYAVGLVLYEAAAGQLPWTGEMDIQVAMQRLSKPPPRPDGVPDALWSTIDDVLSTDVEARPPDARALGRRLRDTT